VVSRREFLDQMLEIACKPGRTILISSHLLSDLERVVDSLAIIHQGRNLVTGNLEDLKAGVKKIHLPTALSETQLQETFDLARFEHPTPDETLATVTNFTQDRMVQLKSRHAQAHDAQVIALNLEDIFVELVGPGATRETTIQESQS
jgi:ABC-2 type transport system ATP-binding protein